MIIKAIINKMGIVVHVQEVPGKISFKKKVVMAAIMHLFWIFIVIFDK